MRIEEEIIIVEFGDCLWQERRPERQQGVKDEKQEWEITEKERHLVKKGRKGELRLSSGKKVSGTGRRVEPEVVGEHCGPEG